MTARTLSDIFVLAGCRMTEHCRGPRSCTLAMPTRRWQVSGPDLHRAEMSPSCFPRWTKSQHKPWSDTCGLSGPTTKNTSPSRWATWLPWPLTCSGPTSPSRDRSGLSSSTAAGRRPQDGRWGLLDAPSIAVAPRDSSFRSQDMASSVKSKQPSLRWECRSGDDRDGALHRLRREASDGSRARSVPIGPLRVPERPAI